LLSIRNAELRNVNTFDPLNQAPDQSAAALLLIDVINDLEFDGGEALLSAALPMAAALARLKSRAKAHGIPVIYANDNFGRWRSDFPKLVNHCLQTGVRGRPVALQLQPEEDDYFVLKPKHSAFFQTNLEILLGYLGATHLILTGMAADICVLFSANDAYMRDFRIYVPSDCVASESNDRTGEALVLMQRVLKADISVATDLKLEQMTKATGTSFVSRRASQ
jgi:nicotinamidase-related amidase